MKKLAMIIVLLLPLAVMAQKSPVDKLFEKYANQDGFTTVNISGKLLNFAGKIDSDGKDATREMLSKLTGIRILRSLDSARVPPDS